MIKPMDVTPEVIGALKFLRVHAAVDARRQVTDALRVLEETGVFAEIDEAADEDAALGLLAESAARDIVRSRYGVHRHDPLKLLRRNTSGA
jgi:hypothetical protein